MKKIYSPLLLLSTFYFLASSQCLSQKINLDSIFAKEDSIVRKLKIKGFSSSNSNQSVVEGFIPPSYEPASFGRYGEYEVELSNGLVPIEIPLYTVESRNLKVPISLSYHASGVKVNDVASSIGLSWSLNCGGLITRTMIGKPDESNNGYLSTPFPSMTSENAQNNDFLCFLGQLAGKDGIDRDGSPDSFFYNFNGSSGRFLIARRDRNNNEITPLFVTVPYKPIKINYSMASTTDDIIEFIITDSDGTKYYFGQNESITLGIFIENTYQLGSGQGSYNSTWRLRKIVSAISNDDISFTYYAPLAVKQKPIYSTSLICTKKASNLLPTYQYSKPN